MQRKGCDKFMSNTNNNPNNNPMDFVNTPIIDTLEKNLVRYGQILWDYEDNENNSYKRYTIFSFDDKLYLLRKKNGVTQELKHISFPNKQAFFAQNSQNYELFNFMKK